MSNFIVKQAKGLFSDKTSLQSKITTVVIFAGVSFGLYWLGKKGINTLKEGSFDRNFGTDSSVNIAVSIRGALNPSGISWFSGFDTTSVEAIYSLARQIKAENVSFNSILKAYNIKYDSDLIEDLRKDLDADEFQMFQYLSGISTNKPESIGTASTEVATTVIGNSMATQYAETLYEDIYAGMFTAKNKDIYIALSKLDNNSLNMVATIYAGIINEMEDEITTLKQDIDNEYLYSTYVTVDSESINLDAFYNAKIRPRLN